MNAKLGLGLAAVGGAVVGAVFIGVVLTLTILASTAILVVGGIKISQHVAERKTIDRLDD